MIENSNDNWDDILNELDSLQNEKTKPGFTPSEFWQNFNLGIEVDLAASLIYEGLVYFDNMKNLSIPSQCFHLLYLLSVGVERLLKVVLILSTYSNESKKASFKQEDFENRLITHDHVKLMGEVKKYHKVNLGRPHNAFIELLADFYKNSRYNRYNLVSWKNMDKESNDLLNFFKCNFNNIKLDKDFFDNDYLKVSNSLKKDFGNLIKKITKQLYKIINDVSHKLNIYTYELPYNSDGIKVYLSDELDFIKERVFKNEILYYLVCKNREPISKDLLPLELDPALVSSHVNALHFKSALMEVYDELDYFYCEMRNQERKERIEVMQNIEYFLYPEVFMEELSEDCDYNLFVKRSKEIS